MSRPSATDPVLRLLADLPSGEPRPARDAAMRERCHAWLATHRTGAATSRSRLATIVDALLPVALSLYSAIVLAEALRLALR